MKKVFLDTNILLDILLDREELVEASAKVFSKADSGDIRIFVSALSFANIFYVLSKASSPENARNALQRVETLVEIIDLNGKIIKLSLNDTGFKDFEDGLQYYSAIENTAEIIITRNLKDFKTAKIPVMTPEAFLKL